MLRVLGEIEALLVLHTAEGICSNFATDASINIGIFGSLAVGDSGQWTHGLFGAVDSAIVYAEVVLYRTHKSAMGPLFGKSLILYIYAFYFQFFVPILRIVL